MASLREPREDAISDIISITSLPREDAIKWLKAYENDANKAVNAFFENPNAIHDQQSQVKFDEQQGQVRWNEDHFHLDNTQQGQNHFGIRPTDTLRPGVFSDAAPSRPPSRVSARVTTTANDANQNATMESEDEQVKRAMAMSMGDSQTLPDQETGVLGGQAFGPATRDHYESDKWAVTISGPQTQEIILNPEPADRKRPKGAPAFLKPSPTGHRLPALLKILHAIPMAREALLNRTHVLPDYGHDRDWWDGTAIKFLKIVNLDLQGRQVNNDDIIYESQRLMAFLDETERAYGSADVLSKTDVMGGLHSEKAKDFYTVWHDATIHSVPDAQLLDVFTSIGRKVSSENPQSETFYWLTARVDDEIPGNGLTLYEVLDNVLWGDTREDEETFFEKIGDVFTLEICNLVPNSSGLGIDIPAVWYADRYLPSSTKQAKDMLNRKAKVAAELDAQKLVQEQITQFSNPLNGTKIDAAHLLSTAITYFDQTAEYQEASKDYPEISQGPEDSVPTSNNPSKIAQDLRALSETISCRMRAFEAARESAYEQLKEISEMYTKPSHDPQQPPHYKYTLRGVSTKPHTTYVLEQTKPDDDDDMLSSEAKDWQWWKIDFVSSDTKPVVREKVTEEFVLNAAQNESANALLVYANEAAISYQSEELPAQLRNFVRADNLNFAKELEESGFPQPATPTKRKGHHHDSDDLDNEHQRSPPYDRSLVETAVSNDDPEPNPPGYSSSHSLPLAFPHQQGATHTTGHFDSEIPVSLQGRHSSLDRDELGPESSRKSSGHEMQERGGGQSLLRDQYTLGSYVPEIEMGDDEEAGDQIRSRGG